MAIDFCTRPPLKEVMFGPWFWELGLCCGQTVQACFVCISAKCKATRQELQEKGEFEISSISQSVELCVGLFVTSTKLIRQVLRRAAIPWVCKSIPVEQSRFNLLV